MDKIKGLVEERRKLVEDQHTLLDKATEDKRDLTTEEQESYDKSDSRIDEITADIEKAEKAKEEHDERVRKLVEKDELLKKVKDNDLRPEPEDDKGKDREIETKADTEYRNAFRRLLTGEMDARAVFASLSPEVRALQQDSDIAGGFLVVPEAFQSEVIKKMKDAVFFRQFCRIISISKAQSIAFPVLKAWPGTETIAWTAELKTGSADTTMQYQKRSMYPHPLARRIKVSNTLLRNAAVNVEEEVRDGLSYVFAIAEEYNFLQGNGVNGPLGVLVADDFGIGTGQDITSGSTGAIDPDDIYDVIYNEKSQYRRSGRWVMGRSTVKAVRLLKDGEGRWMWEPSMQVGEPSRLVGYPISESEFFPTYGTGVYAAIFGDFSHYYIMEALPFQIKLLTELYAETDEVGYICRREVDGRPMLEEAFTRLKLL